MYSVQVVRVAGRGAAGTAYLAHRRKDGREVILKQIPMEQMSPADRQSILTEIKESQDFYSHQCNRKYLIHKNRKF